MNILAPTNFSDSSRNALRYALDWLGERGIAANVRLLNTYLVPPVAPDQLIRLNDEMRATSRKNLEKERDKIKQTVDGTPVSFELVSHMGTLKNVIDHLTRKDSLGCLVLDSGEDLESLLKNAHCPVLVVPPGAAYAGLRNIVQLRERRASEAQDPARSWREKFAPSAAAHDVYVNTGKGDSWQKLMKEFILSKEIDFVIWMENSDSSVSALKDTIRDIYAPLNVPCLLLNGSPA